MNGTMPSQTAPGAELRLRTPTAVCPSYRLQSGAAITAPHFLRSSQEHHLVRRTDSAVRVMTDFAASQAFTVSADRGIDDALDEMFRRGVRALIVLGEDNAVVGLITSYDIQGERTREYLERQPTRHREQVNVSEILTPCGQWTAIEWRRVQAARIGDVLELFMSTGSPYLLVLEPGTETTPGLLRGIISRTRLERQLGDWP